MIPLLLLPARFDYEKISFHSKILMQRIFSPVPNFAKRFLGDTTGWTRDFLRQSRKILLPKPGKPS